METLTSDPHSAPPGAHFLEFLWTRQTQAISASEAIPIGRLWTARDCYTQDRFFAGPPRIATLVPQVPRTGRARNVSLWLLQTVMLPGVSRDVDISQKCRIGVRNVGWNMHYAELLRCVHVWVSINGGRPGILLEEQFLLIRRLLPVVFVEPRPDPPRAPRDLVSFRPRLSVSVLWVVLRRIANLAHM